MRQAGRYLPEYRALRRRAGSFLDLCLHPELAAEATIQPVRRFDVDAAILFADILLIAHALGQSLSFEEGQGPQLSPAVRAADIESFRSKNIHDSLGPVYEAVSMVRRALDPAKALIGFAGAPWTVATYMLAGGRTNDPSELRQLWYDQPDFVSELLDLLTASTIDYLDRQIDAGADAVQIFDSWAGGLPTAILQVVSIEPIGRICDALKARRPGAPIAVFARGVGAALESYAALPAVDAVSIDVATSWTYARSRISPHAVVQGGLDPLLVVRGGGDMARAATDLLQVFAGAPFIFNVGHGLRPETPPEHVAELVKLVRAS
jgi:uroporphyrinogen decarboxylase